MKYNKYMEETKPPVLEIIDQGTPVKVLEDVDKTPVKVEAMKIPLVLYEKEETPVKKANYTPITSDAGFDLINIDLQGVLKCEFSKDNSPLIGQKKSDSQVAPTTEELKLGNKKESNDI